MPPVVADELPTPRLVLRRPAPADAPALRRAIEGSLPKLRQWMAWAQDIGTPEDTAANVARAAVQFETRESLRYHIWLGDELIGSTGYHSLDWRVTKGEIGYWVATPHVGRGYAKEATEALTTYALDSLKFRRLEIRCDAANERSRRIPEQLGYTLDARLIHDDVAAHNPSLLRDTLIFSRVQ